MRLRIANKLLDLITMLAVVALVSVSARPRPGIEEHIAEAAEETFEVFDPPRIRDSSEQMEQAMETHNVTAKLTQAQRHSIVMSQGILLHYRQTHLPSDIPQDQSTASAQYLSSK